MELNKYQESAVLDESNTCLVRANVGSGKEEIAVPQEKEDDGMEEGGIGDGG